MYSSVNNYRFLIYFIIKGSNFNLPRAPKGRNQNHAKLMMMNFKDKLLLYFARYQSEVVSDRELNAAKNKIVSVPKFDRFV